MTKYTTLIFDLDGTLMNSLDDLFYATNYALNEHGMPIRTKEDVCQFLGNGVRKLIERAVHQDSTKQTVDEVLTTFKEYYSAHCNDHTGPYSGICDLLTELSTANYKMAIVSNKPDRDVKKLNEEYFSKYISVALGENEAAGISKKPAPDMVVEAMRLLQSEKQECVYVGDSDVDLATARNSGLRCISVAWGFRSVSFLKEHNAEFIVNEPAEIKKLVEDDLNQTSQI